jgi:hypothetical protein
MSYNGRPALNVDINFASRGARVTRRSLSQNAQYALENGKGHRRYSTWWGSPTGHVRLPLRAHPIGAIIPGINAARTSRDKDRLPYRLLLFRGLMCPFRLVSPFFVMLRGCIPEVLIGALLKHWRIAASRKRAARAHAVPEIEAGGGFNGVLRGGKCFAARNLCLHHSAGLLAPQRLLVLLSGHRFIANEIAALRSTSS